MSTKKCTGCGHIKEFNSFCKSKLGRFGLAAKCRECKSEMGIIANNKKRLLNPKFIISIINNEQWKPINSYESLYEISSFGRIKSLCKSSPFLLKFKTDKDGYLHIGLTKNDKQTTFRVHRLVANAFIANSFNLPEINHKDLNKANNEVSNLEWTTSKGNKEHYYSLKKSQANV